MAVYKDCDRGTWYVSCYYTDLNIPMAGTARTGGWCQPIRANVPMVPASEPLITSLNSIYFSH